MKETKEFCCQVIELMNWFGESYVDREITWPDIMRLIPKLKTISVALEGVDQIPQELASLSQKQRDELKDHIKTHFDIPQDEIEKKIEIVIELLFKVIEIIDIVKDWKAK